MTDLPIDDVVATSEEGLREQALQRVKKRREFHTHLFAYLTINVLLWGVWAMRTAYVGWAEQRITQRQFLGVAVRFIAMYLLLTFFLLS